MVYLRVVFIAQSIDCVLILLWFFIRKRYLSDCRISFKSCVNRHTRFGGFKLVTCLAQVLNLALNKMLTYVLTDVQPLTHT